MDVAFLSAAESDRDWLGVIGLREMARLLAPLQGMVFDAVDVPSFRPSAHLVRPVAAAFGIVVGQVALGLVGWPSRSLQAAYVTTPEERASFDDALPRMTALETHSLAAADQRYTISHTARAEDFAVGLPITVLDMHDTVESFPPVSAHPPGEGPPDLWYVGRLDGAKGPDLFLELAARMPRHLFRRCFYAGPDNERLPMTRWSEHLAALAAERGLDAVYAGTPSDEEIRRRVYGGRVVLVVPSRTDAFNYVALEAVMNGCPILLSRRTGASEFLAANHPHLRPPLMDPDDLDAAAASLRGLLEDFPRAAAALRQALRARPLPAPRTMFMDAIYTAPPAAAPSSRGPAVALAAAVAQPVPLATAAVAAWRPARPPRRAARVSLVVLAPADAGRLPPLLANLARQTLADVELLVVDRGADRFRALRDAVHECWPGARVLCTPAGRGRVNHGLDEAAGDLVLLVDAGDRLAPHWLATAVQALDAAPDAVAVYPGWTLLDEAGAPIAAAPDEPFSRERMLSGHRCLPGPGAVVRRATLLRLGGLDPAFRHLAAFDLWLRVSAEGTVLRTPGVAAWRHLAGRAAAGPDTLARLAAERLTLVERFARDPRTAGGCADLLPAARAAAEAAAADTRAAWATVPLTLLQASFGWPERAWAGGGAGP
ncbi:glycosyltransferase [Azospirillum sp. ST 5-10]|uniref:glycosyltransferase n=1 Tax=unclassified Azospirillum TaxID=2630922 RepID=UPI003F4A685C